MRLDPFALPLSSSGYMGVANYVLKRHPEAVPWFRETTLRLPNVDVCHLGSRPPVRSWDKLRRPGTRPRRFRGSTPV
jgi:hypothetical protein